MAKHEHTYRNTIHGLVCGNEMLADEIARAGNQKQP